MTKNMAKLIITAFIITFLAVSMFAYVKPVLAASYSTVLKLHHPMTTKNTGELNTTTNYHANRRNATLNTVTTATGNSTWETSWMVHSDVVMTSWHAHIYLNSTVGGAGAHPNLIYALNRSANTRISQGTWSTAAVTGGLTATPKCFNLSAVTVSATIAAGTNVSFSIRANDANCTNVIWDFAAYPSRIDITCTDPVSIAITNDATAYNLEHLTDSLNMTAITLSDAWGAYDIGAIAVYYVPTTLPSVAIPVASSGTLSNTSVSGGHNIYTYSYAPLSDSTFNTAWSDNYWVPYAVVVDNSGNTYTLAGATQVRITLHHSTTPTANVFQYIVDVMSQNVAVIITVVISVICAGFAVLLLESSQKKKK